MLFCCPQLNALNIVPPIAIFLAKDPMVEKFDLSHLKSIMCGGAPLGEDVIYQLRARLPHVQNIRQGNSNFSSKLRSKIFKL